MQSSSLQSTTSSSSSSLSTSGLSLAQLEAALENTTNVNLAITSYNFGKGSLSMWITNNGSSAIVLTPHDIIYNGTFVSNTFFATPYANILKFGSFVYMQPGAQIIAELTPPVTPLTGQNATIQILNEMYTFRYGTSK